MEQLSVIIGARDCIIFTTVACIREKERSASAWVLYSGRANEWPRQALARDEDVERETQGLWEKEPRLMNHPGLSKSLVKYLSN